jgi:hypothetical protein
VWRCKGAPHRFCARGPAGPPLFRHLAGQFPGAPRPYEKKWTDNRGELFALAAAPMAEDMERLFGTGVGFGATGFVAQKDWASFTPKVAFNYCVSDLTLTYVSASEGFGWPRPGSPSTMSAWRGRSTPSCCSPAASPRAARSSPTSAGESRRWPDGRPRPPTLRSYRRQVRRLRSAGEGVSPRQRAGISRKSYKIHRKSDARLVSSSILGMRRPNS